MHFDVAIIGAGPTGLMLAGWLARFGVQALILDKKGGIVRETRALGVQARTLEIYDQLGLAQEAIAQGLIARGATLWSKGHRIARADLDAMGAGLSPFPYLLMLPQDRNEALLLGHLQAHGNDVHWHSELLDFAPRPEGGYRLRWKNGDQEQESTCRYLCACDGGHSRVRESAGIAFSGGTYEHLFYVSDVQADGSLQSEEVNLCLERDLFQAFFPMPGERRYRVVGLVPLHLTDKKDLSFEDLRTEAEDRFDVRVQQVFSFSRYRVHHRKAERFREADLFLLGDAAHVHSPVGAQGMNTGLMDAFNLGWKLAAVLRSGASTAWLDTYAAEREPFARTLVNTTDRAFVAVTSRTWLGTLMRTILMPTFFRLATRLQVTRRLVFRFLSQTRVSHRGLAASDGERLPFVPGLDNYAPLRSLGWQVHVYGGSQPSLSIALHTFPYTEAARTAGIRQGLLYLVRPDGYVALKARSPEEIERYLRLWGPDSAKP